MLRYTWRTRCLAAMIATSAFVFVRLFFEWSRYEAGRRNAISLTGELGSMFLLQGVVIIACIASVCFFVLLARQIIADPTRSL